MAVTMLEIAAYTLFILIAALPSLVPVLAVTLPLQAVWLAVRGYRIVAVLCLILAAYCAALTVGPPSAVPGGAAFQAMRKTAERQQFAQKMVRSSSFGGSGAPVTVGDIVAVYGNSASAGRSSASAPEAEVKDPQPRSSPTPRGDEPMVDPTPTM